MSSLSPGWRKGSQYCEELREPVEIAGTRDISALTMRNGEGVFLPFYDRIIASDVT
jgi:hypothetical protein